MSKIPISLNKFGDWNLRVQLTPFDTDSTSPLNTMLSVTSGVILLTLFAAFKHYRRVRRSPLPPGPRPWPFIGNVKDMPTSHEWETFRDWSDVYGDVMHLSIFGYPLILLSSAQAAKELLDVRSSNYSCRPRFPMISELMGWDWAVQFMPYAERFKKHRRAVQTQLHQQTIIRYRPAIQRGVNALISAIESDPQNFMELMKHACGGIMIDVIYGETEGNRRDQYIHKSDEAIEALCTAGNIGTFLVDIIPSLKYVPSWFPGASFKVKAREWRKLAREMIDVPYENVRRDWLHGNALPSVTESMLSTAKADGGEIDHELVRGTAGVVYLGGADTQLSVLFSFVLAMLLFPEVQKRAQAEIDEVVGRERLPSYDDKDSLPYLRCVFLETLRWHPAVPLGVPHRVMQDDFYNGFRIPAGSTVLVNQWAIFRNEDNYKDAHSFKPDRFMHANTTDNDVLDPRTIAFGFGRRKCPGRFFAEEMVWMVMSHMLATFDITHATNKQGEKIVPGERYCTGLVSRPDPFPIVITRRVC